MRYAIATLLGVSQLLLVTASPAQAVQAGSCSLWNTFTFRQSAGNQTWTWRLTRRNATTYDAVATNDQTRQVSNHEFGVRNQSGRKVDFIRADAGWYYGTFSDDCRNLGGTTSFTGAADRWSTGALGAATESGGSGSAPINPVISHPMGSGTCFLWGGFTMRQTLGGQSWTWTLTRHLTTNIFDAKAHNDQTGQESRHTFEVRQQSGNKVEFYRPDSSSFYSGTFTNNCGTLSGTTSIDNSRWTTDIDPSYPALPIAPGTGTAGPGLNAGTLVIRWKDGRQMSYPLADVESVVVAGREVLRK